MPNSKSHPLTYIKLKYKGYKEHETLENKIK